jgi:hypothetical protein
MARFSGIPAVPLENLDPQLSRILYALKENVELLTNQRGEADGASVAVTAGSVTISPVGDTQYQGMTAKGVGASISGVDVPILSDYVKLLQDFQRLAYDVAVLRSAVNNLIIQLRTDI